MNAAGEMLRQKFGVPFKPAARDDDAAARADHRVKAMDADLNTNHSPDVIGHQPLGARVEGEAAAGVDAPLQQAHDQGGPLPALGPNPAPHDPGQEFERGSNWPA